MSYLASKQKERVVPGQHCQATLDCPGYYWITPRASNSSHPSQHFGRTKNTCQWAKNRHKTDSRQVAPFHLKAYKNAQLHTLPFSSFLTQFPPLFFELSWKLPQRLPTNLRLRPRWVSRGRGCRTIWQKILTRFSLLPYLPLFFDRGHEHRWGQTLKFAARALRT